MANHGLLANEFVLESESEFYVMPDDQSASLSWNKASIWGLRPDFYFCRTVASLLIWGTLFDVRTGLSFKIAAGPHQLIYSRVRVPWDSRPYFTVSDSRLPFSSPSTNRRATVEVFEPATTRNKFVLACTAAYIVSGLHGKCWMLVRIRGNLC
jgi:hypothetical protein